MRVAVVSIVASPYQRDLLRALGRRPEVELEIFYLESGAYDAPWPRQPLAGNERVLPGFWIPLGSGRCHLNWPLPDLRPYDIVIMNSLSSVTAQLLIRTSLRRKPWIFWGERLGERGGLHRRMSAVLHRAAGIAAIGSVAADDYRSRFPEPRIFDIPYHCDLQPFLEAPRPPPGEKATRFLFCGQMIARKGVDVLLAAFQRLGHNARLLLAGREADLPRLLAALPAETRARLEYLGFVAPDNLPEVFGRADVFVLPSRYDGWGVVVNQALGAGLPILCSDQVGAGRDLVTEGENGARFPAGDAASLSRLMQRFLDHPELAPQWGAASREKAGHWTPESGAAKWVEALTTLLPGGEP